jgi:hypothetical protein
MALAWVEATQQNGQPVLEVRTGAGSPYYEIFLATRPELMRPNLAASRTTENFYSSRHDQGLLRAAGGRALFPLPQNLLTRFRNGRVHYVVKTYRDEQGNGPSVSPVMSVPPGPTILSGIDPSEDAMQYSAFDREDDAARFGRGDELFASRAMGRSRAMSRVKTPSRRRSASRSSGPRAARPELAGALALVCERLHRMTALDPAIPGRPSPSEHARVLSHLLSHVPAPGGRGSAASLLHAQIRGLSHSSGGPRDLEREVLAARRRLTRGQQLSQDVLPAVTAALGPALAQILPTLLPALLPMLQNLLARIAPTAGAQPAAVPPAAMAHSLSVRGLSTRDPLMASVGLDHHGRQSREQFFAALVPLLTSILPSVLPMLAQLLPSLLGGLSKGRSVSLTAGVVAVPPPVMGSPTAVTGAPLGSTPAPDGAALAGQIQAALAGAGGAAGGAAAMPQMDPAAIGQLLQAVGGAGGGGGMAALAGPGHELIKSVVDRLPIEKMFDGQAWIPQINHDQWIQTMPWDKVLSLSSAAAAVGALFLPGRKELDRLEGAELKLRNVIMTRLEEGQESWIFVADEPARLEIEVRAGSAALSRPFVDVRVSEDGTARGGIQRSVFRVDSVPAGQSTTLQIELPPTVLQRAVRGGEATCLSIRLIEQTGDDAFRGTELRACFHVVNRHSLVLSPDVPLEAASELAGLAGLEQVLPADGAAGDPHQVEWTIDAAADGVDGLARYVPVRQRRVGEKVVLSGGLQISPLGLADLARRLVGGSLDAERLAALKSALEADLGLRQRLSLAAHERLDAAARNGGARGVAVATHFSAAGALLVSFGGIGPQGNPTTRQVTRVKLPVPRGVSLRSA